MDLAANDPCLLAESCMALTVECKEVSECCWYFLWFIIPSLSLPLSSPLTPSLLSGFTCYLISSDNNWLCFSALNWISRSNQADDVTSTTTTMKTKLTTTMTAVSTTAMTTTMSSDSFFDVTTVANRIFGHYLLPKLQQFTIFAEWPTGLGGLDGSSKFSHCCSLVSGSYFVF